jgi:hypothetical protein
MDAVVLNMFGIETADQAIALAGFLDEPSSVLSEDGTIVLTTRGKTLLPSGTIKKAQFVYQVVNKWVELYEMRQLWLNVPKKKGKVKARCDNELSTLYFLTSHISLHSDMIIQKLSPTEHTRFSHALVMYWIYSFCTDYLEQDEITTFVIDAVGKLGLYRYFSNFELAEFMAVFKFFERVLQEACDDCQMGGDDTFRT